MSKIMFVCTGNICRSPMAHAIAQKVFADEGLSGYEFFSSGVSAMAGWGATEEVGQALVGLGLEIGWHRAKDVTQEMMDECSHIFAMTRDHVSILNQRFGYEGKTYLLSEFAEANDGDEDVQDPYAMGIRAYTECRDVLLKHILATAKKLAKEAQE